VPDRFLPDKAIDLVDEAASRVRVFKVLHGDDEPPILARHGKDAPMATTPPLLPPLIDSSDELALLGGKLSVENPLQEPAARAVTADDVAEIVAMWTGVPVSSIAEEESARLMGMEDALHGRIVGQNEAIKVLAKSVRRARAGLKNPRRPIGSFVFLGPTGVGKTELCKALAEFMFGTEDALVQLDMSEFMERHAVSRLVGAPPGYVGYDEAGQLTEAVRRRPYSVICFDEVEKAHPEAFNMLLQIMEDGQLSDAKGHKVDFRNTIVILTSNVGSSVISRDSALGFARLSQDDSDSGSYREMKSKLMKELKKLFRPEFLNRVDEVVVFHELTREDIEQIVDIQLRQLHERLEERSITLGITDAGRELLAEEGYDPQFGARPLRRAIQRLVEDPLAEKVLLEEVVDGEHVIVDAADGEIVLRSGQVIDEPETALSGEQI